MSAAEVKAARFERLTIGAVALLFLLPMLYPPIPPLVDVPGHIGRFMVAADGGHDPFLAQYYSYRWRPIGNLGVDLPVAALAPLMGVEAAAKWVIALIPATMAAGILLTYRRVHGGLAAPGFLAASLVLAMPYSAGFVNYWLGLAFGWIVVWWWLGSAPSRWRAPTLLVAGGALWLMHVLAWLLIAAILAGIELGRVERRSAGRGVVSAAQRLWPLAVIALAMQAYWMIGYGANGGSAGWFEWRDKVSAVLRALPFGGRQLSLVLVGAVAATALASVARGIRLSRGMAFATLLVGAVFVVMPHTMMDSWAADQRIAPVVMIAALVAIAPRRRNAAVEMAALVVMGAVAGIAMVSFAATSDRLTTFLSLGRALPVHSRFAYLFVQDCDPYRETSDPRQHAAGLFIGRNHAFTGQWNYGGSNLMNVHYPAAGAFQDLGRDNVWPERCADAKHPSLRQTLAQLPRVAFDYVIVDQGSIVGVVPVASAGGANLYAVATLPGGGVAARND